MNASIEIDGLRKRFGPVQALDGMTFTVGPGQVTGFVGPNGAGKSTTMRVILGLDAPDAGTATIGGYPYRSLRNPLCHVGSLLDAGALQPGRSGHNHLLWLAHSQGIKAGRVDEVIALAGLQSAARRKAGGYSLGMRQRLGIAAALLGDPETVMLDEPVNGLDPEGVLWVRELLKGLAAEGRTVFISSHLMSEMALTATSLIVVGRGKLLADTTVDRLVSQAGGQSVQVICSDPARLRELLVGPDVTVSGTPGSETLQVTGRSAREIGIAAASAGITLYELSPQTVSLEQAFMDLTGESVEYRAATTAPALRSVA